ncbi:MAG: hypothetical protein A2Z75_08850 [Chloroflexi bacterium RBG_13_50_10]|nr:MAG: hypothetical protein A2Z75_08850 [Chloroflexi bacterium RBG_13_50_10]
MSWRYLIAATLMLLALFSCAPRTPGPTPTTPDSTPATPPSERVPRLTIDQLLQKIESNADIFIVDTRADVEEQFAAGHIKGAIPVPLSNILDGQWIPPADKEIILYCS